VQGFLRAERRRSRTYPAWGCQTSFPVLVLVGIFALYWATFDNDPDPIGFLRSGWAYALATVVVGTVVHAIVCALTFGITTRSVR
jgi:hypothetical protein